LEPGEVGIPYPAYVLLSTSIWGLFMGFYGSAAGTLSAGTGFIMQVKYPHEALLIKQIAQHLAGFLITFIVNIVVLLFFKVVPCWNIVFFPVLVLPLFFLGAGIGLVVSVINVVAADLQKGFDFILNIIFFITPVIYSPRISNPFLSKIIKWNPLTYLIGGVRDSIIYGRIEHWDRFLYTALFSLVIFLLAWRLFFVSEDKVVEKML
jgi:lipopolysaccharide transport system permease protein